MSAITAMLADWLAAGGSEVGEIHIARREAGFELTHRADAGRGDLERFNRPEDAREIAKLDDAGNYRPLKTEPNLRHGWLLRLSDTADLRSALDYFYSATLGTWLAHEQQRVAPIHLRETAARQSGMYAVVKKITEAQANALVGDFCKTDGGCLKRILWRIDEATPVISLPPEKFNPAPRAGELPLLCCEACNLLIAAAREVVKRG